MLEVELKNDEIRIGRHFGVGFQRTLRIPDDGKDYPLPPGLGRFPVCRVEDYKDRVPSNWLEHQGVFIPMYQREALWLNFTAAHWRPNAVKIAIGKINAITGKEWNHTLHADEQDYIICPDQPWLDGINDGEGFIRQFVAMPLGMGYTVEGQVTGREEFGGVQIIVFDPKPGKFPDEPPKYERDRADEITGSFSFEGIAFSMAPAAASFGGSEMGLGAGGKMRQKIYPDNYGIETWDESNFGRVYVHIVNSMMYREITGKEPPTTPVTARTYTESGFPWFDLYDEEKQTAKASGILSKVKSVKDMDKEKDFTPQQDDSTVDIKGEQIKKLGEDKTRIKDGDW